jgi:hypothetical protein
VDRRLIPLNGVVALLRLEPSWPSTLAEQGFRLHLIEADVQSTPAVVRADVIFYRLDPILVVLCECKSGGSVSPRQARSYLRPGIVAKWGKPTVVGGKPTGSLQRLPGPTFSRPDDTRPARRAPCKSGYSAASPGSGADRRGLAIHMTRPLFGDQLLELSLEPEVVSCHGGS